MSDFSVSVVVPAYNAQKTIGQNLCALQQQTYLGNVEIIVVDDGSLDQTGSIVRSFSHVMYVHQPNAGPAVARNKGVRVCSGEIVFFTDADCIPKKNWIEITVQCFKDPSIAAVAGSYGIANPKSRLAQGIYREIRFRHHYRMPKYPKAFGTYNVAIRRSILLDLDGFNEHYRYPSGEDNDLSYKIIQKGKKIFFQRESLVDHFFPTHCRHYLTQQYRHGFWRVRMYWDYPQMAKGDDYTFWKDIVEPPIALLLIVFFLWGFFSQPVGFLLGFALIAWLLIFEVIFAFLYIGRLWDAGSFAVVMFFRSFFRTFGFLVGLTVFFNSRISAFIRRCLRSFLF